MGRNLAFIQSGLGSHLSVLRWRTWPNLHFFLALVEFSELVEG
jgi:hypothetical protein